MVAPTAGRKERKRSDEETHLVVVGDFMVDRAWVLAGDASETSQAHGDVLPKKRLHPTWNDVRPGGAGMHVMALQTLSRMFGDEAFRERLSSSDAEMRALLEGIPSQIRIHALGLWQTADPQSTDSTGVDLEQLLLSQNEIRGVPAPPQVEAHRIATLPRKDAVAPDDDGVITTLKTRFYSATASDRPKLSFRFDQDPLDPEHEPQLADDPLPPLLLDRLREARVGSVFVADFNKGAVKRVVLSRLHEIVSTSGASPPWLVDSKNPRILEVLPERATLRLLAGNREEMLRVASLRVPLEEIPPGRQPTFELLKVVRSLSREQRLAGSWLAIKLDEDGACLHRDSSDELYLVRPGARVASEGIAAGDFFDAALQLAFLSTSPSARCALRLASACASGWLGFFHQYWDGGDEGSIAAATRSDVVLVSSLDHRSDSGAPRGRECLVAAMPKPTDVLRIDLTRTVSAMESRYRYVDLRDQGRIDIRDGMGLVGGFVSTDLRIRSHVRRFVERIHEYLSGQGRTRPLNCLVVSDPGAGKSFLAEQIARQTGTEVVEVNCAQVLTPEDLVVSIGELQSVAAQGGTPLLVLDEVDTNPDYYPYLLAPLWDASISVHGKTRRWGKRTVSILVASEAPTPEQFVERLHFLSPDPQLPERMTRKGPDLASRINGPWLNLRETREDGSATTDARTSRVYLALSLLDRYLGIHRVPAGLLDLLYCAPRSAPRSIEQYVATLQRPWDGQLQLGLARGNAALRRLEELARQLGYQVSEDGQISAPRTMRHFLDLGYAVHDGFRIHAGRMSPDSSRSDAHEHYLFLPDLSTRWIRLVRDSEGD